ncbi:DUF2793 domain-containing protein [Thalassovita mangrovi]|uniref:DUF2793 domain-containing protein n=1 Tax=Thalassovita mangrovi TaxID=2692236 RepID=A0A6L8LIL3_9RHOB|nr:DUF2793 domain-containing protein [Thalassovita mangrovi]MYM55871.1 DUF2793 domain-containing protein [Thalassovita mangrovi]
MSSLSPRLGLPYLQPAQAQKHVTHNEALQQLDAATQLCLQGFAQTDPPVSPVAGAIYGLGAAPTSAWAGHGDALAYWDGTAWLFLTPAEGWRAWGQAEQELRVYRGGVWQPLLDGVNRLGIGTTADATNRLSVASDASLFSHAGTDHRMVLNKATAGDAASVLFQSGWTGHAEIGLAGDIGLHVKVSPDGSSWTEALTLNPADGTMTGAAVQASAEDVTPGRLMRADYGYGPGNLLGVVGQSGGVPTGGVIERGSNANGDYVRFADGTQICTHSISLGSILAVGSGTRSAPYLTSTSVWTYPAVFAVAPKLSGMAQASGGSAYERAIVLVALGSSVFASGNINAFRLTDNVSDLSVTAQLIAIGHWF